MMKVKPFAIGFVALAMALSMTPETACAEEVAASDTYTVSVPTKVPCVLMPDGNVMTPGDLTIRNESGEPLNIGGEKPHLAKVPFDVLINGELLMRWANGVQEDNPKGAVVPAGGAVPMALEIPKLTYESNEEVFDELGLGEVELLRFGWHVAPASLKGTVSVGREAVVGHEVAATFEYGDSSQMFPPAYQWYRGGEKIPGANGRTYTPVAADVGNAIYCEVTDATGRYTGAVCSDGCRVYSDVLQGEVAIDREAYEGRQVTANASFVQPGVSASYQWYRLDKKGETVLVSDMIGEDTGTFTCGEGAVLRTEERTEGHPHQDPVLTVKSESGEVVATASGFNMTVDIPSAGTYRYEYSTGADYAVYGTLTLDEYSKKLLTGGTGPTYKPTMEDIGGRVYCEVFDASGRYNGTLKSNKTEVGRWHNVKVVNNTPLGVKDVSIVSAIDQFGYDCTSKCYLQWPFDSKLAVATYDELYSIVGDARNIIDFSNFHGTAVNGYLNVYMEPIGYRADLLNSVFVMDGEVLEVEKYPADGRRVKVLIPANILNNGNHGGH